ncbi:MAG: hypothetical protein KDB79_12430 [Acidobacteria bacterium]|nr:hypothetical protein [Acidobacteriota bacterium]
MKRFLVIVIFVFLSLNCSRSNLGIKREIKFADGRKGEVTVEFKRDSAKKEIIDLTITKDEQVIKIAEVEKEVQQIWSQIKDEAENKDIAEGLIKYVYIADIDEKTKKPIYHILFFEAERIENGTWEITRVN